MLILYTNLLIYMRACVGALIHARFIEQGGSNRNAPNVYFVSAWFLYQPGLRIYCRTSLVGVFSFSGQMRRQYVKSGQEYFLLHFL
jgi:hypothetical protein